MIYTKGNLLEANAQALVNTVNTVGVMGKGIALQFREQFPYNYKVYAEACKAGTMQIGKMLVVKDKNLRDEKIIINFPTKTEWFKKSQYSYIEAGLKDLAKVIEANQITRIAMPPLGCGNGGLKWDRVKLLMEQYLGHLRDVDIIVFEPNEAVKELLKQQEQNKEVNLTPARAMLLYAMFYYESLGENVSLFVANKLAYFLQRLGEKSLNRLKFEGYHYGPYSVQVEHLLHNINGKYLKGLEQMNAKAFESLELQYENLPEVSNYVRTQLTAEQRSKLSNLVKLIDGFQSALSLEILATVDFIKKDNPNFTIVDIKEAIFSWSERKKKLFQDKYIQIAFNHLNKYGNTLEIA